MGVFGAQCPWTRWVRRRLRGGVLGFGVSEGVPPSLSSPQGGFESPTFGLYNEFSSLMRSYELVVHLCGAMNLWFTFAEL